jgi:hypothetical protein
MSNIERKDTIALITVLFDYPENFIPLFYKNAIRYFNEKDIHIVRYSEQHRDWSLYDKLYYYKIVHLLDYINVNIKDKYEYIIFSDATDTNIYKPIDTNIINIFHSFNADIVFCGEKILWPPIEQQHMYKDKPKLSDKCYLNSGLYMGYTGKIIEHMENIIKENRKPYDDQAQWAIQYLLNNNIYIDQNNLLFFSTLDSKNNVTINNNGSPVLDCDPYFIHDNGPFNDETIKLAEIL